MGLCIFLDLWYVFFVVQLHFQEMPNYNLLVEKQDGRGLSCLSL